jgi:dTDP-4-dehydrorhamnose 3,5-epimerase
MKISPTPIDGVVLVTSSSRVDQRGSFARFYCERELSGLLGSRRIVQINQSCTAAIGAIRGLHFQHPPQAEMKMVRCIRGRVWDVAVDLRTNSPTFLRWYASELTPATATMLVIPEGCAHGFQALEEESELLYLHTAFYTPDAEDGLRHDDPRLGIDWPLPATDLSQRDANHPLIALDFHGIQP